MRVAALQARGFVRFRVGGQMVEAQDLPELKRQDKHDLDVVIDRLPLFARKYAEAKKAAIVVDYDDLLEFWLEVLKKSPETLAYFSHRFRHVLVDEYQDTNTLQSQIVDLIGSHHQVMAVGDDAQCIYTWRGANVENILTFPDRHPGAAIHRIETNYRSSPQILNYANGVLAAEACARAGSDGNRAIGARRGRDWWAPRSPDCGRRSWRRTARCRRVPCRPRSLRPADSR
mgnify:CR=1 FL=1